MLPNQLSFNLISLLFFFCACSNSNKEYSKVDPVFVNISNISSINSFESIIDFDKFDIFKPGLIEYLNNDNILVFDFATYSFYTFNNDGDLIAKFGKKGRGPGEFIFPQEIFQFENQLKIVDYSLNRIVTYTLDGEYVSQFKYESKSLFGEITLLNDSTYITSSNGYQNSLLVKTKFDSDEEKYFGISKSKHINEKDQKESVSNFIGGNIPDFVKNTVTIETSRNQIFVYFNYLSELHNYSLNGSLNWEKSLNLPGNDEILDKAVSGAKRTNLMPILRYIWSMKSYGNDIFLQTVSTPNVPTLIVRIDQNGNLLDVYSFPFIDPSNSALTSYAINDSLDTIYLIDLSKNKLLVSPLPKSRFLHTQE